MMKCLLFAICSFFQCLVYSQDIVVSGNINSNELEQITFVKLGLNKKLTKNTTFQFPVSGYSFAGGYKNIEAGMYRLNDGWFGHNVFITPGDTVNISLKRVPESIPSKTVLARFHKMTAKTKYPGNYLFFDDIDDFFGKTVIGFNKEHPDLPAFRKGCDAAFRKAMNVLDEYKKTGLVSGMFYEYAREELKAQYVLWICTPLTYISKSKLPAGFLSNIPRLSFDNENYIVGTDSYGTAASVYNMYILNDFNPQRWYSNLDGEFHTASTKFTGLLKDRLMAWCLTDYKDKNVKSFDSLYTYFKEVCTNARIKNEVIREIESYRKHEENKPSFASLTEKTFVTNSKNKTLPLSEIPAKKRYLLIDCWATWCVPCKKQLPFLKTFEKKYRDSVQFIYLSLDENKQEWQEYLLKNKTPAANQYILKGNFKSEFASFFNLLTIPRYILFDTEKKEVLQPDMPLPVQQEGFDEAMQEALKNKL